MGRQKFLRRVSTREGISELRLFFRTYTGPTLSGREPMIRHSRGCRVSKTRRVSYRGSVTQVSCFST